MSVFPAKAGNPLSLKNLDSRSPIKPFEDKFHGNDTWELNQGFLILTRRAMA
jgi:hypothetical protein